MPPPDIDTSSFDVRSSISGGYSPRRSYDGRSSRATFSQSPTGRNRSPTFAPSRGDGRTSSGGRRTPHDGRSTVLSGDKASARSGNRSSSNGRRGRSADKKGKALSPLSASATTVFPQSEGGSSSGAQSQSEKKGKNRASSPKSRVRDPKLSVNEERTDMERMGEVALLLLRGRSASADEVLRQMSAPDYVVASKRKGLKLSSEDLPTTALSKALEHNFDAWFLQLASMDDHIELRGSRGTVSTSVGGDAKGNAAAQKTLTATRESPCIAEYLYRIKRLLKFHQHSQRQLSASQSRTSGLGVAEVFDDDDDEATEASLAWHLDSFRERYTMSAPTDQESDEEDSTARDQRVTSRREADHKAADEDADEELARASTEGTYVGQSFTLGPTTPSTSGFGPSDAGVYFVNPDIGFGAVLTGTYSSDLEEPTDYKGTLMGNPQKMKVRLRKYLRDNAYGGHLLDHFIQTVGPEPPRERFGARCRRYLLLNHSSLMPEATNMLSESFHNYLRALAITFRLVLTGTDATIDTIGINDVVRLASHPPPNAALAKAVLEEEQLAIKRLVLTTSLEEISSANSFARSNKAQQAMRERLKAQQMVTVGSHKYDSSNNDTFGTSEQVAILQGGFVVASQQDTKTQLERDVPDAEEHISDAFNRIWCIAKLLMDIYWPLSGRGVEQRRSRRQMVRRRFQAAAAGKNEELTAFYRIASLLDTHVNGSPVDDSVREPSVLTKQQLTFANFLNIASIIAPAIEVASERLLLLEMVKRFGPEAAPPTPTLHVCEPFTTVPRLVQFFRLERFYRFHERYQEDADRLLYQQKVFGDDAEYLGARHTRKSMWQLFCRYVYYADDKQTTEPRPAAKRISDANDDLEASLSYREKSPEFGSVEYFEKRFTEMSAREKVFYNPENFRKLIDRQKRRQRMGIKEGPEGAVGFSTLLATAEEERENKKNQIANIPVANAESYFGELKSLKTLWQTLIHKYGPEPFSESEAADQNRKAEERAVRLKPERRKLVAFYRYYAPEKKAIDVDAAIERFGDNVPLMWELLETKYGPLRPALANDAGALLDDSVRTDKGTTSLFSGDGNHASVIPEESPQLSQLAIIKDIVQTNGDPHKQLWAVDALIKMITKHVERETTLGIPHVPIVNPFQAITLTQDMLDTYLGNDAAANKQRHLLQTYFSDKGFVVSPEDILNLIDNYKYSPMGFEHMWAELVSYYGPEREPIDTENDPSKAEEEFIKRRKTTNDAEVIGKGLVARQSKVVETEDHAHWMLEREDVIQSERLENFFDYYTSGGDHFLDLVTQEELRQKVLTGREAAAHAGRTLSEGMDGMAAAYNEDPNPCKFHRRHTHRSKQELLALQRRFLQGSAGGYELMWRALEAKYGPQPPDAYTRYNMEIKRMKKEAVKRQRASSVAVKADPLPPQQEDSAAPGLTTPPPPSTPAQPLPSWASSSHLISRPTANPNASQSQSSAMVLGSELRKGELMAMSAYADPERALRDLQSSVISTKEEEQALVDMFLRWRGRQKKERMDLGTDLSAGQQLPTMIFEADVKTTNLSLLARKAAADDKSRSRAMYGNALSMSSMRRD